MSLKRFNLQYLGQYLSYYVQTWHDDLTDQSHEPLSLKALSAIGTLISSFVSWHDDRRMHGMYAHTGFDGLALDVDFENICKACPPCLFPGVRVPRSCTGLYGLFVSA